MSPLTGIKLCLFDAYGTLFDFASAAANAASVPADRRSALTTLWRDKQIQYTFLRTLQGRHVEFETVTGDALDFEGFGDFDEFSSGLAFEVGQVHG